MCAQRPTQKGRAEACPEWAHNGLPRMGAQRPARMDAQRTAPKGRTEACPERAPGQEHGGERNAHMWERVTPNARGSVLLVERKMCAVPSGDSVTSLCATEDISTSLNSHQVAIVTDRTGQSGPSGCSALWPKSSSLKRFNGKGLAFLGGPSPR